MTTPMHPAWYLVKENYVASLEEPPSEELLTDEEQDQPAFQELVSSDSS